MNSSLFQNDSDFDWIYPEHLQLLSSRHWTPLRIARKAANFLAVPNTKVLDIGSGIGKFCLAGAFHYPNTIFYGVEQRRQLVQVAENAKSYTQIYNAGFIHANVTQINFKKFDHFYLFNPFWENIEHNHKIDNTIETSFSLYAYYTQYLFNELLARPSGTRLVTYHSSAEEVPPNYKLIEGSDEPLLRMWISE